MLNRRSILSSAAGLTLAGLSAGVSAGANPTRSPSPRAPGATTAAVLRLGPRGLHAGSSGGADAAQAIHLNFSRIVEFNHARLDDSRLHMLWQDLSPSESNLLATLYEASARDSGQPQRLLAVAAERAHPATLARMGVAFGDQRVLEAVRAHAAPKLEAVEAQLLRAGAATSAAPVVSAPLSGDMLNYTLREIYWSYRTAPIGSTGVVTSLYQATRHASVHLTAAWGIGYGAGTLVSGLIQEYAPTLWDRIGSAIHTTVEALSRVQDVFRTAEVERRAAVTFELSGLPFWQLENTGGDFGVVWSWHQVYGSGGGNPFCGPLEYCPPMSSD